MTLFDLAPVLRRAPLLTLLLATPLAARQAEFPSTTPPLAQRAFIKSSNSDDFDFFASSVAVSGNTLVVGAPGEDSFATGVNSWQGNNSTSQAGAAYVFVRDGDSWVQQAYLKASNTGPGDSFGSSVAIDGDTLVVGARGERSSASGVNGDQSDDSLSNSGAAYVFVRSGTTWTQEAYLKASNPDAFDGFGGSVAISGDTLAVGAVREQSYATGVNGDQSDNGALRAGAVYVFVRSGTTWSQEAYVKASNTNVDDSFGSSIDLEGDTLVVGAHWESSDSTGVNGSQGNELAPGSGAVYVFERTGTTWAQTAYVKASNTEPATGPKFTTGEEFGVDVSISGDRFAVGAWGEDSSSTGVDGDQSDNAAEDSGAVYVFVRSGSIWVQEAYLKASNTGSFDRLGGAVALCGDSLLVGAQTEDGAVPGVNGDPDDDGRADAGAAFYFVRDAGGWRQHAYLKASTPDNGDVFGRVAALDGDVAVVGTSFEDSSARGIGGDELDDLGDDSGAAYAFSPAFLVGPSGGVSVASGGAYPMDLDASPDRAGWFYWVFMSGTGTSPGIDFGGGVVLPLVYDPLFRLTLTKAPSPVFAQFVGALDGDGHASAALNVPPGQNPGLAGVAIHHAYVAAEVFGVVEFASNSVTFELLP